MFCWFGSNTNPLSENLPWIGVSKKTKGATTLEVIETIDILSSDELMVQDIWGLRRDASFGFNGKWKLEWVKVSWVV